MFGNLTEINLPDAELMLDYSLKLSPDVDNDALKTVTDYWIKSLKDYTKIVKDHVQQINFKEAPAINNNIIQSYVLVGGGLLALGKVISTTTQFKAGESLGEANDSGKKIAKTTIEAYAKAKSANIDAGLTTLEKLQKVVESKMYETSSKR